MANPQAISNFLGKKGLPRCGRMLTWTSEQSGVYPDVWSHMTRIDHEVKA